MRNALFCGLLLACGAASAARADSNPFWDDFEEGLWQFEIDYQIVGAPRLPGQRYASNRCLTRDDPYPRIEREGQECRLSRQPPVGRSLSWSVNCSSDWEMVNGQGRMHYVRDHGSGDIRMQIHGQASPPYEMVFHLRARRIGACAAE